MQIEDDVRTLIAAALHEDLGAEGDVTSHYFVPADILGLGRIFVKEEPAILSGIEVAAQVFTAVNPALSVTVERHDGSPLQISETVLRVAGPLRSILTAERTALNFIQRLSGIATLTHEFVNALAPTPARILDTRKTTPGWRSLEKRAVAHGGGTNHRMGLFDAVMVKDNHLLARPGIDWLRERCQAVRQAQPRLKIQLEADTLEQFEAFLDLPEVDAVLLDNMSPALLREAVTLRNRLRPGLSLEASGGVRLDTVAAIAATGVDFISVGALTHSARALDFSLEVELA